MRILPGIDPQREYPGAKDEAEHRLTGAISVEPAHRQRTAVQSPAIAESFDSIVKRPAGGDAKIGIECVGLAARKHGDGRPVGAEHRLPHGQHIAHGAVPAAHHQKIDAAVGDAFQRLADGRLGRGRGDLDLGPARIAGLAARVAVAARIGDDTHARAHRASLAPAAGMSVR